MVVVRFVSYSQCYRKFFQSLAIFPVYSNIYVYNQELTQSGTSPFRPRSAELSSQLATKRVEVLGSLILIRSRDWLGDPQG